MKTQNGFFKLLIVILFLSTACTSNDDIEEEANVTKCFLVIEKDTDLPIKNTRISFEGNFGCVWGGCGFGEIIEGNTDNSGEVCVIASLSEFRDVVIVRCTREGIFYEGSFNFSPNITVIYVDTNY